jgi:hypothetical protein
LKKTLALLAGMAAPLVLAVPAQADPPTTECYGTACFTYQNNDKALPNGTYLTNDKYAFNNSATGDSFQFHTTQIFPTDGSFGSKVYVSNGKGSFGDCSFRTHYVYTQGQERSSDFASTC